MKLKFSELRKIPKGKPFPELANSMMRNAIVEHVKDSDVIDLFDVAETNKWFGHLRWPIGNVKYDFVFRYGVCQSFTSTKVKNDAEFLLNVINDNVDFGKEKADEKDK